MSTRITVNVNGSRLLKQARENQLANRQTLTQKESDDKFLADVRQIEASAAAQAAARQREGAVPEYGIKEQTSAQRGGDIIAGINGTIDDNIRFGYGNTDTLSFSVVEPLPGQQTTISKTITKLPNKSWTVPGETTTFETTKVTGQSYAESTIYGNVGTNLWNGPNQLGTPSFFSYPTPQVWSQKYVTTSYFLSSVSNIFFRQYYFLPVRRDVSIFVYHAKNFAFSQLLKKTRTQELQYESNLDPSINPAQILLFYQNSTDTEQVSQNDEYFVTQNVFFCFIYSRNKLRELVTPDQLKTALNALMPDISFVEASTGYSGVNFQSVYKVTATPNNPNSAFSGWTPNVITDTYSETPYTRKVPSYTQYNNRPYAGLPSENLILARQYGIGLLKESNHGFYPPECYSPAIYSYLKGNMALNTNSAKSYEYMRTNYFPIAPNRYINPKVGNEPTSKKLYEVTNQQPVSVDQAVPSTAFRQVKLGYEGQFNCWDWGKSSYCTKELLSLGFTSADLTP